MKVTALFITTLCLLCAGCATKIRTEVTVFHQWPEDIGEKCFRFVQPGGTPSSLERENYERLIRTELVRVGLKEAANSDKHILEVSFNASVSAREVRVIEKYWWTLGMARPGTVLGITLHFGAPGQATALVSMDPLAPVYLLYVSESIATRCFTVS